MAKRERRADRLPEGWFNTFIEAYDIKTTDASKNALADPALSLLPQLIRNHRPAAIIMPYSIPKIDDYSSQGIVPPYPQREGHLSLLYSLVLHLMRC